MAPQATPVALDRKPVTAADLTSRGATCEQVGVFAAEWPDGAAWTAANIRRAAELGLDLDWFANAFLPAPLWAEYKWQEYERQRATLLVRLLDLS